MTQKVKKPYKRNISGFITEFQEVVFTKVQYINEKHQKLTTKEKR